MKFAEETERSLIELSEQRRVFLEGNILKLLETDSEDFSKYIDSAIEKDEEQRRKRLDITRQVQDKNKLLAKKAEENDRLMGELRVALHQAEEAKNAAVNDLDLMQKKSQFELIGNIVQVALWIIMGIGVVTTILYAIALFSDRVDTTLIGNTWSNLFGILLTNSFSIIGTIMGVKYATDEKSKDK
jgi:hypothetical protein